MAAATRRPAFLLAVLLVLALAGAEAGLRLAGVDERRPVCFQLPPGVTRMWPGNVEDPDLFWIARPEYLREKLDDLATYEGPNRVLVLGGSIIAGGENAPGFAEYALRDARNAGYTAHGVNLAEGGYSTHHSRFLLDRVLAGGRAPDLVVVGSGSNDASAAMPGTHRQIARWNHGAARRFLFQMNRSRLFALFRASLLSAAARLPAGSRGRNVPAVPLADFEENLAHMARRASEAGFRLILVSEAKTTRYAENLLAPYYAACARLAARDPRVVFVDPRPRFLELRRTLGIPFADENPAWAGTDFADLLNPHRYHDALFADHVGHFTDRGKKEMGDALFRALAENRLLAR